MSEPSPSSGLLRTSEPPRTSEPSALASLPPRGGATPVGLPPPPLPGSEPAPARDAVLEVEHVAAGYGELPVLRDVSFSVHQGEVVALLGPNGCGKTTLLRLIGKLLPASRGAVRVAGREIGSMSQLDLSRIVASVAQVQRTTFPFSVMDILLTGRMPYVSVFASPGEADMQVCREVLAWFGIGHLESKPITRLSGGERQLVMIARALAQEPRLLLLDEPTTYLDLRNQIRVLDTIRRLARTQDVTVLMTIHEPNQAFAYADGVVLLRKLAVLEGIDPATAALREHASSVIASGEPLAVLTPANVHEAYGVGVEVIEHAQRRLIVPTD
jgi:iron complex transport system ATP-binding protein